ncbi:hypothetical protein RJ639_046666 [Escallonia herrerae]|uniref:Thaumatin-like protein n=1 Tax=Escallonia herrerae TaxID=1293975 RepID=A0AA88W8K4_9ASTE|nr:hypothetical protein RJ639_046666 [Escallonia herrerae]
MKGSITTAVQGAIPDSDNAKLYLTHIEEQFQGSSKAHATTLVTKMVTLKYSGSNGVREHILRMNDMGFLFVKKLNKGDRNVLVGNGEKAQRAPFGYNVGILVVPQGGSGGACMAAGYVSDVDGGCESETGGACNSTCFAFSDSKHCCTVSYGRPDTCKPSPYSLYSKSRFPWAYVYVYGDGKIGSKGFPCASGDYAVTFCPHPVSLKVSGGATSEPSGAKSKIVVLISRTQESRSFVAKSRIPRIYFPHSYIRLPN